jgi:hypothetical protein
MTALQLHFLMMLFAEWVNRSQQDVIEYLQAENRVLQEQLGDGRLLLTDGQRRRLTRAGWIRHFVLFAIDLRSRRVEVAGIAQQPDGEWMKQIARNLTDAVDGFLNGAHYLIHDRDPLFTQAFKELLGSAGVAAATSPNWCPIHRRRKPPHGWL